MRTGFAATLLEETAGFDPVERFQIALQRLAKHRKIQDIAARQNGHDQPGIVLEQGDAHHLPGRNSELRGNLGEYKVDAYNL